MVVCICKGVNEQTIREYCNAACSFKEICRNTGACTQCGMCGPYVKNMVDEHKANNPK